VRLGTSSGKTKSYMACCSATVKLVLKNLSFDLHCQSHHIKFIKPYKISLYQSTGTGESLPSA